VFIRETENVKREIERKLFKFYRFWGSGGQGLQKVAIFTPKGTCVRESTSFEPFCVKIGRGV